MESISRFVDLKKLILVMRGRQVMLDHHLAQLYGVTTFNLNKAVKRNTERFPDDFMFKLTPSEYHSLRFQIGILKKGQHSKYLPAVFTREGIAMLSSVLRSKRAVKVNIQIMRTFVHLRKLSLNRSELIHWVEQLEKKIVTHDTNIHQIFNAIRTLTGIPAKQKRRIGFKVS